MEPVFAGLFAFWLAGERLAARGWLGAACIVAGMLVAELGRPAGVPSGSPAESPAGPARWPPPGPVPSCPPRPPEEDA